MKIRILRFHGRRARGVYGMYYDNINIIARHLEWVSFHLIACYYMQIATVLHQVQSLSGVETFKRVLS